MPVYIIKKLVRANSIGEAIRRSHKEPVLEAYLTDASWTNTADKVENKKDESKLHKPKRK
jgi:hypothetical protein